MVRVLFIDDDPQAQATVSMILAERYTVLPAYSAAAGDHADSLRFRHFSRDA